MKKYEELERLSKYITYSSETSDEELKREVEKHERFPQKLQDLLFRYIRNKIIEEQNMQYIADAEILGKFLETCSKEEEQRFGDDVDMISNQMLQDKGEISLRILLKKLRKKYASNTIPLSL